MAYSRSVNWQEESEKWENQGRNALEEACKHHDHWKDEETNMRYQGHCEKCGNSEDSGIPMMNYAYPLETTPSEEAILKVVNETNCTVMYNSDEDSYYLALTGGGMDLSQDIAVAYQIIESWLPKDLIGEVCTQPELSIRGKDWLKMARQIKKQIRLDTAQLRADNKRWTAAIKEYKEKISKKQN